LDKFWIFEQILDKFGQILSKFRYLNKFWTDFGYLGKFWAFGQILGILISIFNLDGI
jgi:hypothetical protein